MALAPGGGRPLSLFMIRTLFRQARLDPRTTLLGVLLAGVLLLGALLAREAHRAARSHAVTTQRALAGYATVAAWSFLRGVEAEVDAAAGDALAPVVASRAASPYDSLPGPRALAASFGEALTCPPEVGVPRRLVRVDLRDGVLTMHGAPIAHADARWIADTIAADVAAGFEPARREAVILGSGRHEPLALVYGVKLAGFGAPLAAYALVTCPAALGAPLFERVVARRALLPSVSREQLPTTALVALTVRDRHGHLLWQSAGDPADTTASAAEATLASLGGVRVRAVLRPAAAARLTTAAPPPMRLGVLLALLVLTTGLAAVALVQMRREQELTRLRADFTSSVSHELRTPLAQILLYGETLALDRVRTADERREAAETIVGEAKRLMHMVENVLHFARAERGLATVQPQPTRVAPLVRQTLAAFAPLAEGMRLREKLDESLVALVDANAMRQILLNLLDNAVKYGAPGQSILVGLLRSGDRARLWVDDEGQGIPIADRERVWHPYVRMPRHFGSARGGSGIGLSVVRELVEQQGGTVWIEDAPGGGARFVLDLPAVASDGVIGRSGVPGIVGPRSPDRPIATPPASTTSSGTPERSSTLEEIPS